MSRFDSPVQVLGLFVMASFVSVGLIFLINAEQESRLHAATNTTPLPREIRSVEAKNRGATNYSNTNENTFVNYLEEMYSKVFQRFSTWRKEERLSNSKPGIVYLGEITEAEVSGSESRGLRVRRSSSSRSRASVNGHKSLYNSMGGLMEAQNFSRSGTKKNDDSLQKTFTSGRSPSDFHKIRHAIKKLDGGGLEEDVVLRMILDSQHSQISNPSINGQWVSNWGESTSVDESNDEKQGVGDHNRGLDFDGMKNDKSDIEEESKREEKPFLVGESNNNHNNFISGEYKSPVEKIQQMLPYEYQEGSSRSAGGTDGSDGKEVEAEAIKEDGVHTKPSFQLPQSLFNATITPTYNKSVLMEDVQVCYRTDDVLIVIGVTCSLTFTFVFIIWASVKWFSSIKDKDFQQMDWEENGDSMIFPPECGDVLWSTSGGNRGGLKLRSGASVFCSGGIQTASLYTFRPEFVPQKILRRSYSMEDILFSHPS